MHTLWKYIFAILGLILISIWFAIFSIPQEKLNLIACDVGQGDAILAVYGSTQILVDGGPSDKVLECLSENMPFWDREIEVVLLTHPQKDHYGGLVEVFRRYKVDTFIATPLDSSNQGYEVLKKEVGGSEVDVVNPKSGTIIQFGLIHLDIVHPTEDFLAKEGVEKGTGVLGAYTSNRNPNDYSIVAILSFTDFQALLTGDIGPEITEEIISEVEIGDVDYIKVPHHGSKNGLTKTLLEETRPEIAVISVGKNPWGHPEKEVLDLLENYQVSVKRTDLDGDIKVITDGSSWWIE